MDHIANQGLLNKVQVNYYNYPLAIYVLSNDNLKLGWLVDYLDFNKIQVIIDTPLLFQYHNKYNNPSYDMLLKHTSLLFTNALNNQQNIACIGSFDSNELLKQLEMLYDAKYFTILYVLNITDNDEYAFNQFIKEYSSVLNCFHEQHYFRLKAEQLELVLSKYGQNKCYYINNLDSQTLELITL